MSQIQFRISDNDPYVYMEPASGSVAIGTDNADGNKLKIVTSNAIDNLDPSSGAASISIDPSTNGNISFQPQGSGESNFITGDVNIEAGNLDLVTTTIGGTEGVINIGGHRFIHNYGVDLNTYVGSLAGNFSNTATTNTGVGYNTLNAVTSGGGNTIVGYGSGQLINSGGANTTLGNSALPSLTTGIDNIAIGNVPLFSLVSGNHNIGIGHQAGFSYVGAESSNIVIGNIGVVSENNKIHIGTQGSGNNQQNACQIAGIYGSSVTAAGTVVIDSSGQLGTSTNLPIAVPVTVANGGTGDITLATDGVLYGNGTSAVGVTTAGTNGQVLIAATSAAPAFATLTSSGGTITFTPGANTLNLESSSSPFPFTDETSSPITLAVNNGYTSNLGTLLTFNMPASVAYGSTFKVVGKGTGLWSIVLSGGQTIKFGNLSGTTSISSTLQYDSVEITCITANSLFSVTKSQGNLTVV